MNLLESEIKQVSYPPGASILIKDAVNPGLFFVIQQGIVRVDSEHMDIDHQLTQYKAGDSFGLVSAFTEHKYLVSLFAQTEVKVLQIPIQHLGTFLKNDKELALKILRLYSNELRTLQKSLSHANHPSDRAYHPEKLIQNAKRYLEWNNPRFASYSIYKYLDWTETNEAKDPFLYSQAKELLKRCKVDYRGPNWHKNQMELKAGEVLFLESEQSFEIYVILTGQVKLFSIVRSNEYVIDILGPGEIFGEMSLIENAPRMASAITEIDSTILQVTAENLLESVGAPILQKIFESIARRIWFSHQRLLILKMKTSIRRLYSYLALAIRDKEIRLHWEESYSYNNSIRLPLSFLDLCSLTGIIKIKKEIAAEFRNDSNLSIEENNIVVKSRRMLEEKAAIWKGRELKGIYSLESDSEI